MSLRSAAGQSLTAQWQEAGDKADVVTMAIERLLQSMDRVNEAGDADEGGSSQPCRKLPKVCITRVWFRGRLLFCFADPFFPFTTRLAEYFALQSSLAQQPRPRQRRC